MKRLFSFIMIMVILGSSLSGCAVSSKQYHIKEELVEAYQINEMAEHAVSEFFTLSKTAYRKYQKNNDMNEFVNTVYDAFIDLHEGLDISANIQSRLGTDKEENKRLASFSIAYTAAVADMLSLPLRYEENPYGVRAEDVLLAVNNISQHFYGIDLFRNVD